MFRRDLERIHARRATDDAVAAAVGDPVIGPAIEEALLSGDLTRDDVHRLVSRVPNLLQQEGQNIIINPAEIGDEFWGDMGDESGDDDEQGAPPQLIRKAFSRARMRGKGPGFLPRVKGTAGLAQAIRNAAGQQTAATLRYLSIRNGLITQDPIAQQDAVPLKALISNIAIAAAFAPLADFNMSETIDGSQSLTPSDANLHPLRLYPMMILEFSTQVAKSTPGGYITLSIAASADVIGTNNATTQGAQLNGQGWSSGQIEIRLGKANEPTTLTIIPWTLVGSSAFPILPRWGFTYRTIDATGNSGGFAADPGTRIPYGTITITFSSYPADVSCRVTLPGPRHPAVTALWKV